VVYMVPGNVDKYSAPLQLLLRCLYQVACNSIWNCKHAAEECRYMGAMPVHDKPRNKCH